MADILAKLQEMHTRNAMQLTGIIKRLTERNRELERFIEDWLRHTQGEEISYVALVERAKALVEQESE